MLRITIEVLVLLCGYMMEASYAGWNAKGSQHSRREAYLESDLNRVSDILSHNNWLL